MYDRRQFEEWTRTARILQVISNANRNADDYPDPFPLADFHPMLAEHRTPEVVDEIGFDDFKTLVRRG